MKTILITIAILNATAAYAMCTTNMIAGPDGRTLTCITCCDANGRNCMTNCY